MNRRNFIKNMVIGAGSLSPLLGMGTGLGLLSAPSSASASVSFSDYKAIVVVNLAGGNDAMNTFIPTGSEAYEGYHASRSRTGRDMDNFAVSATDLYEHEFYNVDSDGYFDRKNSPENEQPYNAKKGESQYLCGSYHTKNINTGRDTGLGIHGLMPEIASLYNKGLLSLVSNVGTLVEPTTKAQIEDLSANLPDFLFSHIHQRKATQSGQADAAASTGWAGRLADYWQTNGDVGLNLSFAKKASLLQTGAGSMPLLMRASGPKEYSGTLPELLKVFSDPYNTNIFAEYHDLRAKNSADIDEKLIKAIAKAPDFSKFTAKNSYDEQLFALTKRSKMGADSTGEMDANLFGQLEATAKMIKLGKDHFEHNRQIFYVDNGGYDFHGRQVENHPIKLRSLSMSIADFYKSMEEMELHEEVLVVLTSEFGRTLKPNTSGTDHGWGGHSFMLCGDPAFNGGQVFGEVMTDLREDGVNTYTKRKRIIPTTSIEQMLAPALNWFGVNEGEMAGALPNLANFRTDNSDFKSAFLQGVFS